MTTPQETLDNAAPTNERYASAIIILHWLMAAGFITMLLSGVVMNYVPIEKSLKFDLYQWHKSGGVILLIAVFLRIVVRLTTKAPPLPESFPKLEKIGAKAGHIALYLCMLAMPLSGWALVSSSSYGLPTIVFNTFEWPHIPGIQSNELIHEGAETMHFIFALLFATTIVIHIAAVIKHALHDRTNLLTRLWWARPR